MTDPTTLQAKRAELDVLHGIHLRLYEAGYLESPWQNDIQRIRLMVRARIYDKRAELVAITRLLQENNCGEKTTVARKQLLSKRDK